MLLASAVPLNVGVLSLVTSSVFETPVSEPAVRSGALGAAGATVSTVITTGAEATLVLPAASVAVVEMLCDPSARTLDVKLQLPAPSAVVVPTNVTPSYTEIVVPASAVPVNVGVLSPVTSSVEDAPVSDAGARSGVPGTAGAAVSTVMFSVPEAALTLPAASVAVAEIACAPSARTPEVKLQLPAPSAVVVPSRVAPS